MKIFDSLWMLKFFSFDPFHQSSFPWSFPWNTGLLSLKPVQYFIKKFKRKKILTSTLRTAFSKIFFSISIKKYQIICVAFVWNGLIFDQNKIHLAVFSMKYFYQEYALLLNYSCRQFVSHSNQLPWDTVFCTLLAYKYSWRLAKPSDAKKNIP